LLTCEESLVDVLEIDDVHARYGKKEVLRGVSLRIAAGHWFCLLGPNGVGKSTLLLALLGRPRLIVFDEAFNGLDPRSALTLKQELKRRLCAGAAVLLATHALDIVEHHADRAALMMDGRIVHAWSDADPIELRRAGGDFEAALAAVSEVVETRE
jgi:ABC-type multidrug transport system ATPase subunit